MLKDSMVGSFAAEVNRSTPLYSAATVQSLPARPLGRWCGVSSELLADSLVTSCRCTRKPIAGGLVDDVAAGKWCGHWKRSGDVVGLRPAKCRLSF